MPILAKDLIQPINDAEEFFKKFGGYTTIANRDSLYRNNLANLNAAPEFTDTKWWDYEGTDPVVNFHTGIISDVFVDYRKGGGLKLNLEIARNPYYKIVKLPKPKFGTIRDTSGNQKIHKFEFGLKQNPQLIPINPHRNYNPVHIDAGDLSTLPEEFNKINSVIMPVTSNEGSDDTTRDPMKITGKQLTSYKNLFKEGVFNLVYAHIVDTPKIETFEHLQNTQIDNIKMYYPIHFNGFYKIKREIKIRVDLEEMENDVSFFGLGLHNIVSDNEMTAEITGSNKGYDLLNDYIRIVSKHTDLYENQLKTNIMKHFNPKTVGEFDAYYNNITSYPNIDTNLIAKLIGHLLK